MADNQDVSRIVTQFTLARETETAQFRVIEPRFLDGVAGKLDEYAEGLGDGARGWEDESRDGSGLRRLQTEAGQLAAFLRAVAETWRTQGIECVIPVSPQH